MTSLLIRSQETWLLQVSACLPFHLVICFGPRHWVRCNRNCMYCCYFYYLLMCLFTLHQFVCLLTLKSLCGGTPVSDSWLGISVIWVAEFTLRVCLISGTCGTMESVWVNTQSTVYGCVWLILQMWNQRCFAVQTAWKWQWWGHSVAFVYQPLPRAFTCYSTCLPWLQTVATTAVCYAGWVSSLSVSPCLSVCFSCLSFPVCILNGCLGKLLRGWMHLGLPEHTDPILH